MHFFRAYSVATIKEIAPSSAPVSKQSVPWEKLNS